MNKIIWKTTYMHPENLYIKKFRGYQNEAVYEVIEKHNIRFKVESYT